VDYGSATRIESTKKGRNDNRQGFALCLSGGGYRAALFHLGVLRRLNETGLLSQVTNISTASGGSILAAFLAQHVRAWPSPGGVVPEWDERIATPFKEITAQNIRTGPLLRRLIPWNWWRSSAAVEALAQRYRRITTMNVSDLPERPNYVFCATDMSFGVNWEFSRERMGDYVAGYTTPQIPLADAVAASSCFPPVFAPMRMRLEPGELTGGEARMGPDRQRIIAGLRLSDGGVYDNLALEPVWKKVRTVLVSDGGSTFSFEADNGPAWRLLRYTAIVTRQARALRIRWFHAQLGTTIPQGAYCGIRSSSTTSGYSSALVRNTIARIRTDLDSFSHAEQGVLENHGYFVAEAAIQQRLIDKVTRPAEPSAPNPRWLDEEAIQHALRNSSKRRFAVGRY